jgi:Uma2 family endonuclease
MKKYLTRIEEDGTETRVEEPQSEYGFTYADYLKWNYKERLELIYGRIFKMSGPNTAHQRIAVKVAYNLYGYLQGYQCEVFVAPFDVRLPIRTGKKDDEIKTVVQPDLCVIRDLSKLDERGCCGAPELMIEIVSPSNPMHDIRTKHKLYEAAEVLEYWIVNPMKEYIEVHVLNESKKFKPKKVYKPGDIIESIVVKGFSLNVKDTFTYEKVLNY